MGSWTESISDRELPEELVNFRLKSANELARELMRINDALPPGARKRKTLRVWLAEKHPGGRAVFWH